MKLLNIIQNKIGVQIFIQEEKHERVFCMTELEFVKMVKLNEGDLTIHKATEEEHEALMEKFSEMGRMIGSKHPKIIPGLVRFKHCTEHEPCCCVDCNKKTQ